MVNLVNLINRINKETLLPVVLGFVFGGIFLVVNLLFASEREVSSKNKIREEVFITMDNRDGGSELSVSISTLFGVDITSTKNADVTSLLAIENISIKIVAQSNYKAEVHTLLEIVTPKETKRIIVTEGQIVNDFLIESINHKEIVLRKNKIKYTIKLFHPKELNQNRIDDEFK